MSDGVGERGVSVKPYTVLATLYDLVMEHVDYREWALYVESILMEHGNYDWLTEAGSFVVLNNGIEWAATYFVMLLALFALGSGKYVSLDYWLCRRLCRDQAN